MRWVDSHCHVSCEDFAADREAVIERATRDGVATLIAIGSGFGVASNAQAVALAQSDARIFATIGVHPHDASEYDAALRRDLEGLLTEERVVAVGECGLDYHYLKSPREAQPRQQ